MPRGGEQTLWPVSRCAGGAARPRAVCPSFLQRFRGLFRFSARAHQLGDARNPNSVIHSRDLPVSLPGRHSCIDGLTPMTLSQTRGWAFSVGGQTRRGRPEPVRGGCWQ